MDTEYMIQTQPLGEATRAFPLLCSLSNGNRQSFHKPILKSR
jgi:hypothetical protein